MNKTIQLRHPLLVDCIMEKLSSPQKLKLPQIISLPASSLVKVKSGSRSFLCRIYYLNQVYDEKKIAFIDDSVELLADKSSHSDEIKYIQEIELVSSPMKLFKEIQINLHLNINDLNLDVIKQADDLEKLVVSIVKYYTFCMNCEMRCNRNGISKVFITKTNSDGYGTIENDGKVVIEKVYVDSNSLIRRNPLGGLSEAETALADLFQTNIKFIQKPETFNYKPHRQILITGPVGSGKTTLVHNIAKQFNCILFEISGDIFQPFPGETEENLERTFERIKTVSRFVGRNQLTVVLIENLEIFCPKFNAKMKENSHSSRISSLLLSILDEISESFLPILVIGTTSKLELLNSAVRRCNRMGSSEIILDMPNESQRFEILKIFCQEFGETSDELLSFVAQSTPGFVGADLEVLCQFVRRRLMTENLEKSAGNCLVSFELGLKAVNPSVMRENLGFVTRSTTLTLDSIGGLKDLKKTLQTSVLGPLKHSERFQNLGLRSPSGILFYGPSGCAKTTIVKCLAGESKITLISVSSAEIYSPYVGEAEKFIVKLFNQARMNAPTILFFDEIDTIVGNRSMNGGGGNDSHMRILSTLLTEIDGFGRNDRKTVLIVGATNKPQMIDDALMRPGRFDKLIHVPAPDIESRLSILKFIAKDMPIAADVDMNMLAEKTENFSGADLVNLCNEAALNAATKDLQNDVISIGDFQDVFAYLRPSLSAKQIEFYANFESFHRSQA
ncbi:CLUMA_CG003128, isoform A [Clunio marinus]|uniref:CLUMA_CG003128, isoform A n=1 Tax=Clunio marinus TaxID=568069 RepID=A0A1J1HMU8_9DIPT|nr:CLUMA_CG003128, isoform A [Clunio marinus]